MCVGVVQGLMPGTKPFLDGSPPWVLGGKLPSPRNTRLVETPKTAWRPWDRYAWKAELKAVILGPSLSVLAKCEGVGGRMNVGAFWQYNTKPWAAQAGGCGGAEKCDLRDGVTHQVPHEGWVGGWEN